MPIAVTAAIPLVTPAGIELAASTAARAQEAGTDVATELLDNRYRSRTKPQTFFWMNRRAVNMKKLSAQWRSLRPPKANA